MIDVYIRGIKYHRSDTNITKVQHCLKRVNDSPSTEQEYNINNSFFFSIYAIDEISYFVWNVDILFLIVSYTQNLTDIYNFRCAKFEFIFFFRCSHTDRKRWLLFSALPYTVKIISFSFF